MIINQTGASYCYGSIEYTIGSPIVATDKSDYHGLYGRILEIKTDADKDTDNSTIDIYCEFTPPVHPDEIKALENRFSALYGTEKRIDEIALDRVIMAPEMIYSVGQLYIDAVSLPIYIVLEDCAQENDSDISIHLFASYDDAKRTFNEMLKEEFENGLLHSPECNDSIIVETAEDSYDACYDGDAAFHYSLSICKEKLSVSTHYARKLFDGLMAEFFRRDFEQCLKERMNMKLTEEQFKEVVNDPFVSLQVMKQLSKSEDFKYSYRNCIDAAIDAILQIHFPAIQISGRQEVPNEQI